MSQEFETESGIPEGQAKIDPVRRMLEQVSAEEYYKFFGGRPDPKEFQGDPGGYNIYYPEPLPGENAFQLAARQSLGLVENGIEKVRLGLAGKSFLDESNDDPFMARVTVRVGLDRINLGIQKAAATGVDIPQELNTQVSEVGALLEQTFNSAE